MILDTEVSPLNDSLRSVKSTQPWIGGQIFAAISAHKKLYGFLLSTLQSGSSMVQPARVHTVNHLPGRTVVSQAQMTSYHTAYMPANVNIYEVQAKKCLKLTPDPLRLMLLGKKKSFMYNGWVIITSYSTIKISTPR